MNVIYVSNKRAITAGIMEIHGHSHIVVARWIINALILLIVHHNYRLLNHIA